VTRAGRPAAALRAIRRRDGYMIEVLTGSAGGPLGEVQSGLPVVGGAADAVEHGYGSLDLPGAPV
jgi:hypothetical protein